MNVLENETVLVTGGAGYIGSHTVLMLLTHCRKVIVLDNLRNFSFESIERVKRISRQQSDRVECVLGDVLDEKVLEGIFAKERIFAVIHFAGLKAVGESVMEPLLYYENNVVGTASLLKAMANANCKNIIFSSSATVYGEPKTVPCTEEFETSALNPYGRTKLFIEHVLTDLYESDKEWNVMILRYFNPVGAHESGEIGEDPKGIPNNLMPFVQQVAVGRRTELSVFGTDYNTKDGTGRRDYIHVVDLANGHVAALQKIAKEPTCGKIIVNLGTGKSTSVLELVSAFEKASGKKIPMKMVSRRPGDAAEVYAKTDLAFEVLGWRAEKSIEQCCIDQWNWASKNPFGYSGKTLDDEDS